ncbi:carbonic anhydrase [Pseudobacteriovorax antillogorgiicola]|uniref:carbonic anhydrase n=1 Tax=Pseudobacteriovorax antillogorgiicola TaxID=1513793 RepID=A0A1Y6BWZ0_9BACT|nr:carbonic anhydrase family protein [Pseudobacteriovorax antillogorgiicola]TCS50195.1 carbonic anhydrase [Pseudobacteriovorax antillogorgiicola]SMF32196.1 Carbonic anhydrase [Pseudobacteriovorax antillogorgiicola]
MVQKKKSPRRVATTQHQGTPSSIVTALIVALPLFTAFGIRDALLANPNRLGLFTMACLLIQGLFLCFFWKRIASGLKSFVSYIFVFSIWAYMIAQAVSSFIPISHFWIGLIPLASVGGIGVLLMLAWAQDSGKNPSNGLAVLVSLALIVTTVIKIQMPDTDFKPMELAAKKPPIQEFEEGTIRADDMDDTIHASDDHASDNDPAASEPKHLTDTIDSSMSHDSPEPEKFLPVANEHSQHDQALQNRNHEQISERPIPKMANDRHVEKLPTKPKKLNPSPRPSKKAARWDYRGNRGPHQWARLSSDYRVCNRGKEQSPVNIPSAWDLYDHIRIFNRPMDYEIVDDGHGIKVQVKHGIQTYIAKRPYELKAISFHSPSEHQYERRSFPMEIQLRHENKQGKKAFIGVLVTEGKHNSELDKVFQYLPKSRHQPIAPTDEKIDVINFLPKSLKSFHYFGSLTHPPCTEGVNWNVLNNPIEMSKEQIRSFRAKYRNNARPPQLLYHRS